MAILASGQGMSPGAGNEQGAQMPGPQSGMTGRDLALSYNKVGDLRMAQGNLPAALTSYQAGLDIIERLAKSDAGNTEWQRDLAVSYAKVGDAQLAQGNLPAALASYQASLAIMDALVRSDPSTAPWQRDLWVSYNKIGDAQLAQGNLLAALASYQASLAIMDRLVKSDQGLKAREALAAGRAIMAQLVAQFSDRAQWKQVLAWFDARIAELKD